MFGLCNTNDSPLSGLYTCTVEWSVEAPVETQYRVVVLVPPSITSLAARGEVREGDTAEIECQGGQHPPAGYTHDIEHKLTFLVPLYLMYPLAGASPLPQASGSPPPSFSWETPARGRLETNTSMLRLDTVSREDRGECVDIV